ncbi:DNA protection during starvation protein [compost metagenome]
MHDGRACVESLLESFRELLVAQRRILAQAAEAGDEGTASILSDYVQQQEKLVWMLRAYLA